ncbi:MAG: hypothetical protein ABI551_03085 [Polyangiaceae bacterium]
MPSTTPAPSNDTGTSLDPRAFWRALLYRWFVEYNPAYLLSAAFVFGGCFLWSRGVVGEASLTSTLGIPFVAELYAMALVGGAALLTRVGQRRPAVLLALVFAVYQWDTTLHTEACAYLGAVGALAAAAWLVLFVGKLWAVGWALRIRLARRMLVAFVVGAVGLVVLPRALPLLDARGAGSLLAAWLFSLLSLYRGGEITSIGELDAWGVTVLRRATHGVWAISAAMLLLHVDMWCTNADVSLAPLSFALPLLAVRSMRSEARTWALVLATLGLAALLAPACFSTTALFTASALLLRIFAPRFASVAGARHAPPVQIVDPYRAGREPHEEARVTVERIPAPPLGAGEIARASAGALFAIYLGVWTARWSHGAWPAHLLWLDAALTVSMAVAMWRSRARLAFAPPVVLTYVHLAACEHLIPMPHSSTSWGELGIALGFTLLGGSLLVSYRLRGFEPTRPPRDSAA